MSIRITNFTIEKARNGYILDNDNTGKNEIGRAHV